MISVKEIRQVGKDLKDAGKAMANAFIEINKALENLVLHMNSFGGQFWWDLGRNIDKQEMRRELKEYRLKKEALK